MRTGCFARMSVFEQAIDDQSHAQLEARAARLRQPGKQFKLGFFTQVPSRADQPARRTYDELVESIVAAEDIGYDSVWIGQHHFSPEDGGVPSPLVVLAAAAARTKRIHLGTAVIALPFEHPIRLAEDLAVLDEISGGRVQIGLGGARGDLQAFNTFGVDFSARHDLFDRNLEVLQHLLDGRSCAEFAQPPNVDGNDAATPVDGMSSEELSASDAVAGLQASADVEPKRLFPGVPSLRSRVWQTASSEDRARKIARNGNGLMIGAFHDHVIFHQLRFIVGYLEEWLTLNGNLDEARVGAQRFTYHGESADAIAAELGAHVSATQKTLEARFPQLGSLSPKEYLRSVTRSGTSRDIVQQLLEDPALLGFVTDFFPTTGLFPSVREGTSGADLDVERLRLFAEEIAPELGWKPPAHQ
jgi:alkanesulfonate monooxygenase SsuD/methylene tetrahydromethanopterin reductase-like flavin-dependent oxidoreductase (luciferase family)